jgi:cellulose synthase/poly-beta-1,6-N-acetylglucosamine synthase-like glycosyltransferase
MTIFDHLHTAIDSPGPVKPLFDTIASLDRAARIPALVRDAEPVARSSARTPLVTVVIPCYNYARFLPGAVDSCLSQEGVAVEVVIVDDASPDDTAEVAERLSADDDRVRVLHNERNLGHVRTFNSGLAQATGEFVVRLDADDLLTPGALDRAMAVFEAHPSVGLVYGHPRHFTTPEPPSPVLGHVRWTVWRGHDWIAERTRRGTNCITTPEAVIRASVLADVGGLNTQLRFAQDMEMWLRTAVVSDVGRVNGADQALHRDHPDSMSENEGSGHVTDLEERRAVFTLLFDWARPSMSGAVELAGRSRRVLATEALAAAVHLYDRGRHDDDDVAALVAFARNTYPAYRDLPDWRRLSRTRQLGPRIAKWSPLAAVRVVLGRLGTELQFLRWTRTGV